MIITIGRHRDKQVSIYGIGRKQVVIVHPFQVHHPVELHIAFLVFSYFTVYITVGIHLLGIKQGRKRLQVFDLQIQVHLIFRVLLVPYVFSQ